MGAVGFGLEMLLLAMAAVIFLPVALTFLAIVGGIVFSLLIGLLELFDNILREHRRKKLSRTLRAKGKI